MKKTSATSFLRRVAALLLALALAVPVGYARAGDRKLQTSSLLTDGLTYYNTITQNASSRIESFSLERAPDSAAYPILLQGSGTVYGAAGISKAVAYAQSLGYHVLGAVNTDFFSTSSGVPIGMVIEDGVYKSSPEEEAAMAIVNGQTVLIDAPQITLTLTNQNTGSQVQPHHLNKWRASSGGLYLLNSDFSTVSTRTSDMGWYVRMRLVDSTLPGSSTGTPGTVTQPDPSTGTSGVEQVLPDPSIVTLPDPSAGTSGTSAGTPGTITDPVTGEEVTFPDLPEDLFPPDSSQPTLPGTPRLTANSVLTLEVVELIHSDQAIPIGADEYILTAADASGYISTYESFHVGDRVTLTSSCADPVLSAAQWAGGVGDVLVRNGAVTDSAAWTYVKTGRAPRTALGVKADGTLVVYAVDGRQSGYSMGLSELDLAQEMQALGCQWAVNVDGGGSTAISVWVPGQESVSLRNKPSDGVQRGCATYLLLVTDDAGTGLPDRLVWTEDNPVVLAGSTLPLPQTAVLDSGLNVLPTQAPDLIVSTSGLGAALDGVYIAGPRAGTDSILLFSPMLGVQGSAQVHIVESLTELTVSHNGAAVTSLTVKPGETAQLSVTGTYWSRTALRDLSAVTWTVENGVGTIDENGLFTMNANGGSGSVTAHAGGLSRTVQITTPYTHNDVGQDHWAYGAVEYCYSHGVVNGISATEYGPDELVARGDFVLMLYRASGKPAVASPCTFTDVAPDAYYADALAWAQSAGLTAGSGDGSFRPGEPATREEAFTILRQVMPLLGKDCPDGSLSVLEQFADWEQIAEYARGPIASLVSNAVVNGKGAGIDPKGNLTRAEMATLLYKVLATMPDTAPSEPVDPSAPVEPTEPTTPDQPTLPDPSQYTLTLDQTSVTLDPAGQATLIATLSPAVEGAQITWTSSDPIIAPVTQEGVVTNILPSEVGAQVTVTASWNGLTASCVVDCKPAVFIGTVTGVETVLNVRSGGGTDYPVTGSLSSGTQVVVVAVTRAGWYHIHYLHQDGYAAEGYVSGDYLVLNRG